MDRSEIVSRPVTKAPGIGVSLPLKITGIVFWGMMLMGLVIAIQAMRWLEDGFTRMQQTSARNAILETVILVSQNPEAPLEQFQPPLQAIMDGSEIRAITIERGIETLTVGDESGELIFFSDSYLAPADVMTDFDRWPLTITVCQPSTSKLLAISQKQLMIGMGLLFFIFGLILQWILKRVLSKPFLEMVQTAETCVRDETARFDEKRVDEFGYLAGFINKALDSLELRQSQLNIALQRAVESERELLLAKEQIEVTLCSIAEGVITTDTDGKVQFMNPAAEEMTGVPREQARNQPIENILKILDEQTRETMAPSILETLETASVVRPRPGRILVGAEEQEISIQESAAPMRDSNGNIIGAVLVVENVQHALELTRKLTYQATHDDLTGLYNRREFERRLQQALELTTEQNTPIAICYLDLDQFKIINDTCGHIAGDELLHQLGKALQAEVRESDTLARLGGDEFGILLQGCSIDDANRLAKKLKNVVSNFRFVWGGKTFQIGVSIGVVPLTPKTHTVTEALSAADVACYAAKDSGRNRVHLYEPDDRELLRRQTEMQWVEKIRHALRADRFRLYTQSIVPVSTDRPVKPHDEILLRMLDDDDRIILPARFLTAAEQFGLMPEIDLWVLRHSLDWLVAQARDRNLRPSLAINLSGQSLSRHDFLDRVVHELDQHTIAPEQICFEITETAAIADLTHAGQFIRILKGMGCRFALDDFGSGMSSFAYLKNLPVDFLKIDGSYVRDVLNDPMDRAMIEAVNKIGHTLGMQTVAEFVENLDILAVLKEIGVDFAQGYGIAKPVPLNHWPDPDLSSLQEPA